MTVSGAAEISFPSLPNLVSFPAIRSWRKRWWFVKHEPRILALLGIHLHENGAGTWTIKC